LLLFTEFIPREIAEKYDLVPETHNHENKWYKIVLMNHVEVQHLTTFIDELKASVYVKKDLRKNTKN
jgi:hypothetical protein